MLDRETKTKNTIIGRFMALFVTGVVCLMQAIPVFAAEPGATAVTPTDITITFSVDTSITKEVDYQGTDVVVEFTVPLYAVIAINNADIERLNYLSGHVYAPNILAGFSFTVNGFVPLFEYFEPEYNGGVYTTRIDTSSKIIFDNYNINTYTNNTYNRIILGYMHYSAKVTSLSATFSASSGTYTPALLASSSNLYATSYEYGYVEAMIYALNNSANIEDMLSVLNSIDANMLPEILSVMRSNHTALYNLIQNIWTTDQAVLSVDRQIYNTVLSILAILEDAYAPQASQAEDIKEDVEQNLSNLISDIELTKPSQVANIADDYIAQIDTSYNNLAFGFLSNNTIVLMLCIVAGLAIISYMLYGGQ